MVAVRGAREGAAARCPCHVALRRGLQEPSEEVPGAALLLHHRLVPGREVLSGATVGL